MFITSNIKIGLYGVCILGSMIHFAYRIYQSVSSKISPIISSIVGWISDIVNVVRIVLGIDFLMGVHRSSPQLPPPLVDPLGKKSFYSSSEDDDGYSDSGEEIHDDGFSASPVENPSEHSTPTLDSDENQTQSSPEDDDGYYTFGEEIYDDGYSDSGEENDDVDFTAGADSDENQTQSTPIQINQESDKPMEIVNDDHVMDDTPKTGDAGNADDQPSDSPAKEPEVFLRDADGNIIFDYDYTEYLKDPPYGSDEPTKAALEAAASPRLTEFPSTIKDNGPSDSSWVYGHVVFESWVEEDECGEGLDYPRRIVKAYPEDCYWKDDEGIIVADEYSFIERELDDADEVKVLVRKDDPLSPKARRPIELKIADVFPLTPEDLDKLPSDEWARNYRRYICFKWRRQGYIPTVEEFMMTHADHGNEYKYPYDTQAWLKDWRRFDYEKDGMFPEIVIDTGPKEMIYI